MSKESKTSGGISFAGALFLVFLVLKLTHTITWSWWWVTAPLWGGLALAIAIMSAVFLFAGIGLLIAFIAEVMRNRRVR